MPHLIKQFDDEQMEQQRGLIKEALGKLNQNVAIPMPKTVSVLKVAINTQEYDSLRKGK